jgi:DNA-binding NarL/FixJ family response regulator
MLAVGDVEDARGACGELEQTAERHGGELLDALAADARGALALADGDAVAALASLRRAWLVWEELEAPYEAARARVQIARACRALGDRDTEALELEAARALLARLGARPELARVDSVVRGSDPAAASGLTTRELEVLRLVAAGKSNRAIAAELFISDHTVRRHLQNIFRKIGVSSRAGATAFAFRHELV